MAEVKYYLDEAGLRSLWAKLNARDQEIVTKILLNTDAINLLNATGDGTNPAPLGSVQRTVADEIAKVVADAPEDFDTLKEIADWIAGNPDGAAGMNALIQANKADIDKIKTLLEVTQGEDGTTKSTRLDNIESDITDLQVALGTGGSGSDSITQKVTNLEKTVNGYTNPEDSSHVDGLVDKVSALETKVNNIQDIPTAKIDEICVFDTSLTEPTA